MDGTVLPYGEGSIPTGTLEALRALCDNGVRLAVASGRDPESLRRLLAPLDRPICMIAHDGALAFEGDRPVYRRPIEGESVRRFFLRPEHRDRTLVFYGERTAYLRRGNGDVAAMADVCMPVTEVKNAYAIKEPVYKVAVYGPGAAAPLPTDLRPTYRDAAVEEYVCAFVNKGTALSDLQMRLPATVFDTAVAGDGRADLPMFPRASVSFVPAHAPEQIRAAAKQTGALSDFLWELVKNTQK